MTSVFIDRRLLSVHAADADPHALPGVSEALAHLTEAGHRVVLVDEVPELERTAAEAARRAGAARPTDEPAGDGARAEDWLLTSDRADCGVARRHGLRTVLVGPHLDNRRPTDRCDEEARDLSAAALAILAADAMGRS